jgi:hypothetical protein
MIFNLFKSKPKENIIFLHLPKAGGTTLRHVFYDQYKYLRKGELYTINRTKETPDFLNLPQKEKDKIKVLVGHFPFGLHEHLRGDFKYVTFMRDPVDRVISAYYYNKGHQSSDVYEIIKINNLTLGEYLDRNIEPWSNNAMTKHFAGCSLQEFKEECTQEMFEKAKINVLNHCIAVGLTEKFDESLLVFQSVLNWSLPTYERKNITPIKKGKAEQDVAIIERIRSLNAYDLQLYELGAYLFQEAYNQLEHPHIELMKLQQ